MPTRKPHGLALYPEHWGEAPPPSYPHPPTWHHPSAWPHPPTPPQQSHDLILMLGRIAERTEETAAQTKRIESRQIEIGERLIRGDARFEKIEMTIEEKLAQLSPTPAASPAKPPLPWVEICKVGIGATALIGAAAGFVPWDQALKLFGK
mgnify:CR=1 FL=1